MSLGTFFKKLNIMLRLNKSDKVEAIPLEHQINILMDSWV